MRAARHLALALAWACSLLAATLVLLYVEPEAQASTSWVVMIASFIPYGIVLWALAVVLFLVGGRRWTKLLAFPALVALVVQVGWARPYWPGTPAADVSGDRVRVLATNVYFGLADPDSVAGVLADVDPDVIVVAEATEPFLASAAMTRALSGYQHRVGRAAEWQRIPSGTVVLSRLPLTEVSRIPSQFGQYVVEVDAGATPLTLVAAHPLNMITGAQVWEREGRILADAVRPLTAGPLVVAGDFNATPEHLTLRRLLDEGLVLAAQDAGAGWQPTFTNGLSDVPIIPIDHILTNDRVRTLSYRTLPIAGSDHWAVVADLVYR